jgi:amino acid transporter
MWYEVDEWAKVFAFITCILIYLAGLVAGLPGGIVSSIIYTCVAYILTNIGVVTLIYAKTLNYRLVKTDTVSKVVAFLVLIVVLIDYYIFHLLQSDVVDNITKWAIPILFANFIGHGYVTYKLSTKSKTLQLIPKP